MIKLSMRLTPAEQLKIKRYGLVNILRVGLYNLDKQSVKPHRKNTVNEVVQPQAKERK